MRRENKSGEETATSQSLNEALGWFDSSWYYVSIAYSCKKMGLLVATEDEEEAWREGEEVCAGFGAQAKTLSVTKVVIQ
jgi:hypothetical protein